MKFTINEDYLTKVYLVEKDNPLNGLSVGLRTYLKKTVGFSGKLNEKFAHLGPKTDNIILVGLGDSKKLSQEEYIYAASTAANLLKDYKVKDASVNFVDNGLLDENDALQAVTEGFLQASYQFDHYLSEKSNDSLKNISIKSHLDEAEELIQETEILMNAINYTRDLVNTPANDLYPENFSNKILDLFNDSKVKVEVYDKNDLEELGASSLLAVSKGAVKEPRLVVMKYLPLGEEEEAVSIVGKGVTYDSGGYAIKSASGMKTMMTDMAGAGATVGALDAIAKNNIQENVVGIVALTENMISGDAMKNGDIISSLKGSSIEVVNTDAEGRLILADALYYAATKIHSKTIIDSATLTGAVVAALGKNTTGVMTNNQKLYDQLLLASQQSNERIWQLPITKDDQERVKGKKADLVNGATDGAGAGTIYAAAFLEHFVEDIPWIHLDIAGTSYQAKKGDKYRPNGASGIPVKTFYQFIKNSVQ